MFKKIIITLLVVGLLGGVYAYFFMYHKSHPDYENLEVEMTVGAHELFNHCKNDGKAVDYTGKILEIYGIPQELESHDSLMTLVFAYEEGMFGSEGVRVTFLPKYNQELSGLEMNTELRVKAYCTGYNDTDVVLEKASLINDQ